MLKVKISKVGAYLVRLYRRFEPIADPGGVARTFRRAQANKLLTLAKHATHQRWKRHLHFCLSVPVAQLPWKASKSDTRRKSFLLSPTNIEKAENPK